MVRIYLNVKKVQVREKYNCTVKSLTLSKWVRVYEYSLLFISWFVYSKAKYHSIKYRKTANLPVCMYVYVFYLFFSFYCMYCPIMVSKLLSVLSNKLSQKSTTFFVCLCSCVQ